MTAGSPLISKSLRGANWLQLELAAIEALAATYENTRGIPEKTEAAEPHRMARASLLSAFERTTKQIADREGITAALVSHDGLVLAQAGRLPDFDAFAAVAQGLMRAATTGAQTMALGRARQLVLVGDEHKFALFRIGPMVLSIICPLGTQLSHVLRE